MKHPITWGVVGGGGIAVVFYLTQALGMQSWTDPISFSLDRWYYIAPLILGFGIQMSLFQAIRRKAQVIGVVATSGGASTGAMVACCMHNFTTLLPFLGLTGVAILFARYQDYLFIGSIAIILIGIGYMVKKYNSI